MLQELGARIVLDDMAIHVLERNELLAVGERRDAGDVHEKEAKQVPRRRG